MATQAQRDTAVLDYLRAVEREMLSAFVPGMMSIPSDRTPVKREIHVDTAEHIPISHQTTGAMYGKDADEQRRDLANSVPKMVCPSCLAVVTRLTVANSYTKSNGEVVSPVPRCPVVSVGIQPFFYSAFPCGCRVLDTWASAWSAEMTHRLDGGVPRPIAVMSEKARSAALLRYESALTSLYKFADNPHATPDTKAATQLWSIIVADQMQRLCPEIRVAVSPIMPTVPTVGGDDYLPDYPLPRKPRRKRIALPSYVFRTDETSLSAALLAYNMDAISANELRVAAGIPEVPPTPPEVVAPAPVAPPAANRPEGRRKRTIRRYDDDVTE